MRASSGVGRDFVTDLARVWKFGIRGTRYRMEDQLPSRWKALDRARHDMASGRLWKARDRLTGYIGSGDAKGVDAFELLAEVYFAMGDLPQAGKLWYLTGRDDEQALAAIEAWRARCGNQPSAMARSLASQLPSTPLAQERFRELRRQAGSGGRKSHDGWSAVPRTLRDRFWDALVLGSLLAFTVGIWIVGVASIIWFLTR